MFFVVVVLVVRSTKREKKKENKSQNIDEKKKKIVAHDRDVIRQGLPKPPSEGAWQIVVEVKPAGTYYYSKYVRRDSVNGGSTANQVSVDTTQKRESVESTISTDPEDSPTARQNQRED